MNLEERILNIAEAPAWFDSRELRAIALDVRKMEERIKRLEEAVDAAISFCEFHGPVGATPDTARLIAKNLRRAKEAKP